MSLENPYRAAGAFSGKAYIRRDADAQLIEQIEDNQYYPYFAAPRQSGKSSLLLRTMAALDPGKYRVALVDLSPFVVSSYDDFWRQFLHEIARGANFDPAPIGEEDPRDVLLLWLRGCNQRLIVFMDEIDVLLGVDCREQIFSKLRTFFNLRARLDTAELQRVQFVLAGAAHSSRFIKDPRWSPFNVAIEIELSDLSAAQVSQLAVYLATAGAFAGPDLTARVHELTGGSVFLCQLVFEQLWNLAARGKPRLDAGDVDAVVTTIVAESPRNIHFYNIFRLVTSDARLTMLFRRLTEGQELGQEEHKELRLTGICRGASPFRNEVYARVFGPGGPLDLKVGDRQIQLTRALDAAIARRDDLLGDPRAEPRALVRAEADIRKVRRSFREGTQLQVGDVLGHGHFRLEEHIGQGGFAAVWRATDLRNDTTVAIKILHGQFAEDKSRRDRFFRGAWKMSELQHPAIVRVLEPYGDENGRYYFVMEFLPDGTLHDSVQELEMSGERALRLLAQVGEALHFAHSRGLVHRDVKPSNVMIDGERAKLTDFDLVRETDLTGGTRTGAMGTFIYAAPEVMSRPQDADARADIYGLGMTAVFALFGGDLAMDVIRDADRFIDHLPCNPVVQDVLKKAVAWDRDDRFDTAAEFVAALERACELPVAAPGKAVFTPAAAAAPRAHDAEPSAARTSPGMLGARTGSPAPMVATRSKSAASGPSGGSGSGSISSASISSGSISSGSISSGSISSGSISSAETQRRPAAPGRTSAAQPVAAADRGGAARPGPSGPALSVAAQRAMRALEALDEGEEEAAPDTKAIAAAPATTAIAAAPAMIAAAPAMTAAAPATTATAAVSATKATAAATPEGAKRAEAGPAPGASTWPKGQVQSAGQEPPAAARIGERATSPRQRTYLVGLAASLLLLLIGRSVLQADGPWRGESEPARGSIDEAAAESSGSSAAAATTTGASPGDEAGGPAAKHTGGAVGPTPPPRVDGSDSAPHVMDPTSASTTGGPEGDEAGTGPEVARPTTEPPRAPSVATLIDEGCREVRLGDARRGVDLLMAAHDRSPRSLHLRWCLADGYAKLGKYESALRFYNDLLTETPRHAKALRGAAQANEYLNRRAAAAELYQRLLKIEPRNASARAFLAGEAEREATSGTTPRSGERDG